MDKMMDCSEYIKNKILQFDSKGKIKCRERADLEYKETFNLGSAAKYAKTMASFANNIGGYIIFGVKDKPREIIGVGDAFDNFNQEKLTDVLNSYFSPEIIWETGIVETDNGNVGYIYVSESIEKPVMAIKGGDAGINNGDVFYRYKARSEKIKYPEMQKILIERERRLQESIIKVVEAIRNDKTPNIGIINYSNGKVTTPYGVDVTIDRKLVLQVLRRAKFIKSGSFKEEGEPVLTVTGNIELAEEIPVPAIEPDIQYPYIQKQLAEELDISITYVYALIWHYKLKGDKKYHIEITTSKNNKAHKFSEYALLFLKEKIKENAHNDGWLESIRISHNQSRKENKNGQT